MMTDVEIIGVLKSYIRKCLEGVGALKGAPCEIQSITETSDGYIVTFKWEDTEGVSHTNTMEVKNGKDGSIASVTPTLSTGTKIAEMVIDGNTVSLYAPDDTEIKQDIADIWKAQNVLGAKNLITYPYYQSSVASNGIRYVAQPDGSILASGTATAYAHIEMINKGQGYGKDLKAGDYIFSLEILDDMGEETDIDRVTMIFRFYDVNVQDFIIPSLGVLSYRDRTKKITITPEIYGKIQSGEYQINIRLYANGEGVVIPSGTKFCPMLRLASDPDDTWTPYAPSNKELADKLNANTVSVTPTLSMGTKIAEIKVGGTTSNIYAPAGGSGTGDMLKSEYDPTEAVEDAGGIINFLEEDYRKLGLINSANDLGVELANVKDYGAVGDGITDDSSAFIQALNSNNGIWIPRGTYNLNHANITLSSLKGFVGEGKGFVVLLDSNITAPYGIACKGITFRGGTTGVARQLDISGGQQYSALPTNIYENTIAINVTPYVDVDSQTSVTSYIRYKECIFENVGTASLAYQNTYGGYVRVTQDIVEGCIFRDLVCAGVYHRCEIGEGRYVNNRFENIGRDTNVSDKIVALKSGDTSNMTEREVENCLVMGNVFDNIISYNDIMGDVHAGEVNMITVQAEHVTVINNEFRNLVGCGHDREGVYLKAHFAEIASNYFENAGLGEGYICCKRREKMKDRVTFYADANVDIHDNTMVGDYGCAIKMYYGANIHDNDIRISCAKNLIHAGSSQGYDLKIHDNSMYCGMIYPVVINGTTVDNYYDNLDSNNKIIVSALRIYEYRSVYMVRNHIVLDNRISDGMISQSSRPRIVGILRFYENIDVRENVLRSGTSVSGLVINTTNAYTNNVNVCIEDNDNDTNNSLLRVDMNPSTSSYQNIRKWLNIKNNTVKHSSDLFDVYIDVGAENNDVLSFDTQNRITISANNNYISTNVAYVEVPDETWVKQIS